MAEVRVCVWSQSSLLLLISGDDSIKSYQMPQLRIEYIVLQIINVLLLDNMLSKLDWQPVWSNDKT
jgi:hypothetical protein